MTTDTPLNTPLVSVIIPCFNAARFIARTLRGLQAQTLTFWEAVVVNDGSTDASAEVVAEFADADGRIRLVSQPNAGLSQARNVGFTHTNPQSQYVVFLDADDVPLPPMLETLSQVLDNNPAVGLAYVARQNINENDELLTGYDESAQMRWRRSKWGAKQIPPHEPETPFETFFAWYPTIPSAVMLPRPVFAGSARFSREWSLVCEDIDLFMTIALRHPVHFVQTPLLQYRRHTQQASAGHRDLADKERRVYRAWMLRPEWTTSERNQIARAWFFKQVILLPALYRRWAWDDLKSGRFGNAAKQMARSLKPVAEYHSGMRHLRRAAARSAGFSTSLGRGM